MKKRNITPLDFYRMCYTLPPDLQVSIYGAHTTSRFWHGEFRAMPVAYRNATIDHMSIVAADSNIVQLSITLQEGTIKYD